jgi:hypothetical protein
MAEAQVHRLPVVDDNERLVGILSVTDVLRGMQARPAPVRNRLAVLAADALAMVCGPRGEEKRPPLKLARKPARKPAGQREKAAAK